MDKPQKGLSTESTDLEIFKLLVEMADRVSQRRQTANSFYLSINTLLVGGSTYLSILYPREWSSIAVSVAGIAICALWSMNIISYKTLNAAKFSVINSLETRLPFQPFTQEWSILDPDDDGKRHNPFHKIEIAVPWVFAALYIISLLIAIPWRALLETALLAVYL
jgi:hypothetical protein